MVAPAGLGGNPKVDISTNERIPGEALWFKFKARGSPPAATVATAGGPQLPISMKEGTISLHTGSYGPQEGGTDPFCFYLPLPSHCLSPDMGTGGT